MFRLFRQIFAARRVMVKIEHARRQRDEDQARGEALRKRLAQIPVSILGPNCAAAYDVAACAVRQLPASKPVIVVPFFGSACALGIE